jgi:hypothetical protein
MRKQIVIASIGSLIFFNCKKIGDFGNTNVNPNWNVNLVPNTSQLITSASTSLAGLGLGILTETNRLEPQLFVQYLSQSAYPNESRYSTTNLSWNTHYAVPLADLQQAIKYLSDPAFANNPKILSGGSVKNQLAIARILKVFYFSLLTDRYGDIPYSKALDALNVTPAYDKQQDIYTNFFKELKEAKSSFESGTVKGDIFLGGDVAKWKKFSNSLRMIFALRLSKIDPVLGKAEFVAALGDADGTIAVNADNANFKYDGASFLNPVFDLYSGRSDYGISEPFVNLLNGISDPRLKIYGKPNAGNSVKGVPYGLTDNLIDAWRASNADYSEVGDNFRQKGSAFSIVSAAQILFCRAEAAELGWTSENAANLYNDAIKASWEQHSVFEATAYANYIGNSNVALGTSDRIRKIVTQKYIALYPNGNEAWSEWRRTGFPVLTPTQYALNTNDGKVIPRRYAYPVSEVTQNGANYQDAVNRFAGKKNSNAERVWWDKP